MNTESISDRKDLPDNIEYAEKNIVVFDDDRYFLAMLKGYCYVNHIAITEVDFTIDGINELEKIKPALIVVPLDLVSAEDKSLEAGLLRRAGASGQVKICGLNRNSTDMISAGLSEWIDVIINNPFDIHEIGGYIKKTFFLMNSRLTEKRNNWERRSVTERKNIELANNGNDEYNETRSPGFKNFQVDHCNKCVFLEGHKVELTDKEFELIELLLTDVDRIFMAKEIINQLWPENNQATKSYLYQYMHLLRKKNRKRP
jgi:DNA-binding response OmpR family regulator